MTSGAAIKDDNKKHVFKDRLHAFFKTTPALITSIAAATVIFWGMFSYAIEASPLGERVQSVVAKQDQQEQRLNDITNTVNNNSTADEARHNQTMAELWTVQLLGMIDRGLGNPQYRQQVLVLHQKIENAGGNNDYIEYEVNRYLKSVE